MKHLFFGVKLPTYSCLILVLGYLSTIQDKPDFDDINPTCMNIPTDVGLSKIVCNKKVRKIIKLYKKGYKRLESANTRLLITRLWK